MLVWFRLCQFRKGGISKEAKYWITSVRLAKSRGFRNHELAEMERILVEYQNYVLEMWRKEEKKRGNQES
ncbi:MAG: DUF4160 domain-containing protein [Candidatus Kuenenia stuttgartiensis]|nr:DUF4160 domain-containing protein [Candidatus Kuenenia stuttgartiensis]